MHDFEQRWSQVEFFLSQRFTKVPELESILFLIGVNELQNFPDDIQFSKEEKQELMHIAVCKLLSQKGYYTLTEYDKDGWPHYTLLKKYATDNTLMQERLLKECIINYFEM